MRVIVAGSRDIWDHGVVAKAISDSGFEVTELVSGGARGVDQLGEYWAKQHKIPIKRFLPDWTRGRVAGIFRNRQMADYAEALVAVWDGKSRGTKNMIEEAKARGLRVFVVQAAPTKGFG